MDWADLCGLSFNQGTSKQKGKNYHLSFPPFFFSHCTCAPYRL